MGKQIRYLKGVLFCLIFVCLSINIPVLAATEKTDSSTEKKYEVIYDIPDETSEDILTVSVRNSAGKTYYYTIFNQCAGGFGKYDKYLKWHGCAISSLTTLLASRVSSLADYNPSATVSKIEPKVFGKTVFRRNYNKKLRYQMPITMYGMTRILKKYKIKHKYVYSYSKKTAEKQITANLKKGNPVIITVKKGKWASTYHTMLLIGLDEEGRAIVADSANRKWAKKNQRIKYATVSELLKSMWSGRCSKSAYWNGYKGCGGYILIY